MDILEKDFNLRYLLRITLSYFSPAIPCKIRLSFVNLLKGKKLKIYLK